MNHYEALLLHPSASLDEIKRQYQKLVLQLHPDKAAGQISGVDSPRNIISREAHLQLVLKAWEVLRDPDMKAKYDLELSESNSESKESRRKGILNASVDLDDMEYNEETSTFKSSCRCGGEYLITESELEQGIEIVLCSTCTLSIKVLYSVVAE